MGLTTSSEKAVLRQAIKAIHLSDEERHESDERLFARFLALAQVKAASTIFLYYGVGEEPDTSRLIPPLLQAGKTVALPRCLSHVEMEFHRYLGPERLQRGTYGIPEPSEDASLLIPNAGDLMVVPALCCDRRGFRLGHGGGYYDRYLARHAPSTMALCRETLLLETIPVQEHDVKMGLILTERECLSFC